MNPKNLGDIKHGLEHGLGVYAGQNNGAVFLQPNGAVIDNIGQQILSPSADGKAIYDAFAGFNAFTYTLPAASADVIGGVKLAENVPEAAGAAPTAAEFKALLDALIAAGVMATAE